MNIRTPSNQPPPTVKQLAQISALADGTLPDERRGEVEAMLATSPELSALYERERHVVGLLHRTRERERAPARLRERLATEPGQARSSRPRRLALGGAAAGAIAVAGLTLALVLPAGTPGAPSPSEAALLADRGPSLPPPAPEAGSRLRQAVDDVYFPNWAGDVGWRASGQRIDRLGSHRAVTVYYAHGSRTLAYTIVSPPALGTPPGRVVNAAGLAVRVFTVHGKLVATWRRGGDTCVLSGSGTSATELARLAAWE